MAKDLRSFIEDVKKEGSEYYIELSKPLDTVLEPCMLQQQLGAQNKFPVMYCHKMKGSKLPLVTNTFGSYDLMGIAMDIAPGKGSKRSILEEYMKRCANLIPPVEVNRDKAPVREVILKGNDVDLGLLPIVHHAKNDHGKYLTTAFTICKDPETGIHNAGWYRHEILNKNTITCMINPNNHGKYIARKNAELGNGKMEVALVIGHHPAVVMGSCVSGSIDLDELQVMGGLIGEALPVVKGETVDLLVPADAEIVLEGYLDTTKEIPDGPFAEFAGYYGHEMPSYEITITAITMRHDAIYHDLDPAHTEHNLSGVLSFEASLYNSVKAKIPSVLGVHLPPSGCCLFTAYIQIKKRVPGEGTRTGLVAIGAESMLKTAIVVDEDIDIYNERDVMWAFATRFQADKDFTMIPNITGSHLDPTAYDETRLGKGNMVTKCVIDATRPVSSEFAERVKPPKELMNSVKLEDFI